MSVYYQPYTAANHTDFTKLVIGLYDHSPEGQPMTMEKINATIDYFGKHPDKGSIILFFSQDEVVGYSILIPYWSNEYGGLVLFVDELFVRQDCRNQRIGSDFLQYLLQKKAHGFKAILLEVFPSNTRAYEFYTRNGFEPNAGKFMRYILG